MGFSLHLGKSALGGVWDPQEEAETPLGDSSSRAGVGQVMKQWSMGDEGGWTDRSGMTLTEETGVQFARVLDE